MSCGWGEELSEKEFVKQTFVMMHNILNNWT